MSDKKDKLKQPVKKQAPSKPAEPAQSTPSSSSGEKVRIVYERRSIVWSILAFVLAFILGIIATVGAIIGVGFWALNSMPVQNVLNLLPEDYRDIVREDKSSKTVLQLITDITSTSWDGFAAIDAYTPFLRDTLTELTKPGSELSSIGVNLDVDEVMALKFSELRDYLTNNVMAEIQVGKLLGINGYDSAVMRAICYGKEGANGDYIIGSNGTIIMNEGKKPHTIDQLINDPNLLNNLEVAQVLEVTPSSDPLTIALCYGEEGVNYQVNNGDFCDLDETDIYPVTIKTLSADMTEIVEGIAVDTALSIDADSTPLLRHLAYGTEGECYEIVDGEIVMLPKLDEEGNPTDELHPKRKIADLSDAEMSMFEDMTVGEISGIEKDDPDATQLMKTICDWTLKELTEDETKVKSLKVGELITIGEDASPFVLAVSEWELSDLENSFKIERLKLKQVIEIDDTSSILLQAMAEWRISELSSQEKIDSIFINQMLEIDETSPLILQAIADSTLGNLADKVNSLTLAEMIDENELQNNKVLKHLKNFRVNELAEEVNGLTIKDVFEHEIYSYTTQAHHDETFNNAENPSPIRFYVLWSNTVTEGGESVEIENIEAYYVRSESDDTELLHGWFYEREDGKYVRVDTDAPTYDIRTPVTRLYEYQKVDYDMCMLLPLTEEEELLLADREADENGNEFITTADGTKIEVQRVYLDEYAYLDGTPVTEELDSRTRILPSGEDYFLVKSVNTKERYYLLDETAETDGYASSVLATTAIVRYRTTREIPVEDLKYSGSYTATPVPEGAELTGFLNGIWWIMLGKNEEDLVNTPVVNLANVLSDSTSQVDEVTLQDLWLHGLIEAQPDPLLAHYTISGLLREANDNAHLFGSATP